MAAYRKNDNGSKLWLVESAYGGWIVQYRPTKQDAKDLARNQYPVSDPRYEHDINVYSIKVKEIERKKIFSIKTKHGRFTR